jgi:hypothetical protein
MSGVDMDDMAEWREQIGPRVFLEMVCTHDFKGGVCDICWGNTQRACRFIEAAELARQEAQNEVNILSAELAEMRGRLNASRVLLVNARSVNPRCRDCGLPVWVGCAIAGRGTPSSAHIGPQELDGHRMMSEVERLHARAVDAEIEVKRAHDENRLLRAQKKRITNDLTEMTESRDYWYARAKAGQNES